MSHAFINISIAPAAVGHIHWWSAGAGLRPARPIVPKKSPTTMKRKAKGKGAASEKFFPTRRVPRATRHVQNQSAGFRMRARHVLARVRRGLHEERTGGGLHS